MSTEQHGTDALGRHPLPGQPGGPVLASPWLRLGASLLTGVFVFITLGVGYLIWCFAGPYKQGTTPAKKMLGMRCINTYTGEPLNASEMAQRGIVWSGIVGALLGAITLYIFTLIDALKIFGDGHQRFTDKWANSLVVMA